ncbi:MAG TPA: thioredoxin family protein [Acidobacteriaceae bacterium]|jgi:thiol-disulfide isomerase/thioredoxin
MPIFKRKKTMPAFPGMALAIWVSFVLGTPIARAQEAPSIVGSSPSYAFSGATGWFNSKPLTAKDLKGKVVLIDFWDYSCINCIRAIPYIRAWADKYKDSGLVVIGVHTPEFDVEKQLPNVQKAVQKFGISYPVAVDSNYAIWNAFHNQAWPAHYFIDAKGKVRYEHFGEGEYDQSERWIQQLLQEANAKSMPSAIANVRGQGVQAAADIRDIRSPETYIGYARAEHFASQGGLRRDANHLYPEPTNLQLNQWGFSGQWLDHEQAAVLQAAGGKIVFRFHARDLHLVLGPTLKGKPVRYRVMIDGHAPGENHGVDTDAEGNGIVMEDRLYQLVRQQGSITDHVFTIEFEDSGVQAFSFTFG